MIFLLDFPELDFDRMPSGLIPAVIQDQHTRQVLMLGYMSRESFEQSRHTGLVTFYSRSRERLWTKGETSGNTLEIREVRLDCDQDCLLFLVQPNGPVCHTGSDTCWNQLNQSAGFLSTLEGIIKARKSSPSDQSYTSRLLASGLPKVAQKVGEEAVETVIEALGDKRELFLNECADLLYHLLVLLAAKDVPLAEVEAVLRSRHK